MTRRVVLLDCHSKPQPERTLVKYPDSHALAICFLALGILDTQNSRWVSCETGSDLDSIWEGIGFARLISEPLLLGTSHIAKEGRKSLSKVIQLTAMSNSASTIPRIGVAVFILHPVVTAPTTQAHPQKQQYKFILGLRKGSHGSNTWALPGGHLEHGESLEACATRETLEETGLNIEDVRLLTATNDLMPSAKQPGLTLHYVTVFMVARVKGAAREVCAETEAEHGGGLVVGTVMPDVKVMEPDKCAGWEWVSWENLEAWVKAQILREEGHRGQGEGERCRRGTDNGGEIDSHNRQLFTPMVNLLLQRPGVIPS